MHVLPVEVLDHDLGVELDPHHGYVRSYLAHKPRSLYHLSLAALSRRAEPTTNVAEDHSDVPQALAADLQGETSPRDHFFNCARAGIFSQARETAQCQIKLTNAPIKGTR